MRSPWTWSLREIADFHGWKRETFGSSLVRFYGSFTEFKRNHGQEPQKWRYFLGGLVCNCGTVPHVASIVENSQLPQCSVSQLYPKVTMPSRHVAHIFYWHSASYLCWIMWAWLVHSVFPPRPWSLTVFSSASLCFKDSLHEHRIHTDFFDRKADIRHTLAPVHLYYYTFRAPINLASMIFS